jgi:tetratricopeptide (TPR) repeat protein
MAQNHTWSRYFSHCLLLAAMLLVSVVVGHAQSGTDSTGTGGRHSISGRLVFPSGQRADMQLKIRLESPGFGDLSVLSDLNGSFSFQGLKAGNYTVIIEGGEYFESVRENVFIEPYSNGSTKVAVGIAPVSRPINVQIYLRPKSDAAHSRPGVLNAALANVPKPAVDLYEKGLESVSRGESDRAIEHFKAAINLYPEFGLALNQLGVQYLKRGDLDKADEVLVKATKLLPDNPEPSLNHGIVLLQKKRFNEAETQLRDAVKKNDQAFTAHLYFGITLIYVNKHPEAETELRKAIALGGAKAGQAHYYLGGLYWQTHNYRQAADELEMYLKLEPKAANAEKVRTTIKELRTKS